MKTVLLGDIVTIKGGGTPDRENASYWGGAIPWASVKDFRSTEIATTVETITGAGLANSASNLIPAGAIIVPTRMAVGKAAINTVDIAINQDLKALFPIPAVHRRFLLHQLLAASHDLERRATGATVKGITLDVLRELPVSLPPIEEQRRIAAILDQADALRAKRRAALAQLDEMARAIFVEMFGDPATNDLNLPTATVDEACSRLTVGFVGPMTGEYLDEGVPLLRSLNVKRNAIELKEMKFVSPSFHQKLSKSALQPGDVVTVRTGRPGTTAVIPQTLVSANCADLIVMTCSAAFLPDYLSETLNLILGDADHIQGVVGAIQSHFNIAAMRRLRIPAPAVEAQQLFVDRVTQVRRLRSFCAQQSEVTHSLFTSLQHRAFRGDL